MSTYQQRRLVPLLGRKAPLLNSKICRQHAAKCIETAEAIPPGPQREMFFDMAKRWTDLAINIESSEALADPASPPANDPGEPYRFGSRIGKDSDQVIRRDATRLNLLCVRQVDLAFDHMP